MEPTLLLFKFLALAFGVPLLILCLFFIPEYFRVNARVEKAKVDLISSYQVVGMVISKKTEFVEINEDGISSTIETHNYFDINFEIDEKERRETIKIIEKPKLDWLSSLFQPKMQSSYEVNSDKFTAYYNHLTHEIISLEQMTSSLNEHSFVYIIVRFYVLIMLFFLCVAVIGVISGSIISLFA